ncbi:MAG: DUF4836 family protein [Ferruginibacter sp.]
MLKRFRLPFVAVTALVLLLASCGKTSKQGKLIPKDAVLVFHINGESLNSKLSWDEIKKNELFNELYADSTLPPFIKSLLDDPENSGIDTKTDIIGFGTKDSLGGYVAIEGTVKDAAKFDKFNTFVTKGGSSMEKDGMNFISKAPMCVGWNKERFLYIIDMAEFGNMSYRSHNSDADRKPRDVGATCRAVFELKEENSLAKDEKFASLMSDKADMHFWFNTNALMNGNDMMGIMSMTKISDLYKDAVSTGSVNFENGKINIDFKNYAGKETAELFSKYQGGEINTDMFKRFAGKDIAGAFAINFKPEVIREILKRAGADGLANMGLSKFGITVDDFVKANKGDIFIAASDVTLRNDTIRYGTAPTDFYINDKPKAKYIFAVSINDKTSFNNLINAAQKLHNQMGMDSAAAAKPDAITFNSNDKFFAIGNDKALVDQYIAGGNNDFDFLKNISGNPMGGYVNIQGIMKALGSDHIKDSTSKEEFNTSLKFWQDIYIRGGKISDGGMTQSIEINLMDKNTNSLKQLNSYFGKMGQLEKARQKDMEDHFRLEDEKTIAPKADTVVMPQHSRH